MKITEFYNKEYLQSALYQSFRSIANYIDGLKPSSRKVIYTIDKNNITHKIKSSQLCSKVAEETQYLHGEQSLSGVIVGLARNYVGSNNINLLMPDGNFGSRFITEPSASRYIYTYKTDIFDVIFNKDDAAVLDEQWFEGEKIEHKYYVPILPLILVNGSEGIGNGFAQKILPRSVEDVKKEIEAKLKNSKYVVKDLPPYFKGFNGSIIAGDEPHKWIIEGKFNKISASKIEITEVPIGYDLKSYLKILDDLVDKKVVKDYDDNSNDDNFNFICRVSRDFINQSDDEIMDQLRLKKVYSENYTSTNDENAIIEFNSTSQLLGDYIKVRLEFYSKRKKYLISEIDRKVKTANNRVRFIKAIIENSKLLMNKKRGDVEKWLKTEKYDKVSNSYDYLLRMPVYSFTKERVDELEKELASLEKELETISKKTPKKMWLEDLKKV